MATFDLLQPLGENNREEHILVEYEGFIHSTAENLIIALEDTISDDNHDSVEKIYPKLKDYIYLTPDELYDSVLYYEAEQLLDIITDETCTPESIEKTCIKLLSDNDYTESLHDTFFNEALMNLATMTYTKSITFMKHTNYHQGELNEIKDDYQIKNVHALCNIKIYTGSLVHYYMDHPEITTVLLGNPDDLKYLIENADKEHLAKTLFILRNNIDTINIPTKNEELPTYKNDDYYQELIAKQVTSIVHANIDCIRKDIKESEIESDSVG